MRMLLVAVLTLVVSFATLNAEAQSNTPPPPGAAQTIDPSKVKFLLFDCSARIGGFLRQVNGFERYARGSHHTVASRSWGTRQITVSGLIVFWISGARPSREIQSPKLQLGTVFKEALR
jgi:hypothetical protein